MPVRATRLHEAGLLAAALTLGGGCRDLDRFDTRGDRAYCGVMNDLPFSSGIASSSSGSLSARLELDSERLTSLPGELTTDDTSDGPCAPEPLFAQATLRAIPQVSHDALSTLEFGSGRDYNFFAWVDSTCKGTMVAIVSLMHNQEVEVRLLRPAAEASATGEEPGFGVIALRPSADGCGF